MLKIKFRDTDAKIWEKSQSSKRKPTKRRRKPGPKRKQRKAIPFNETAVGHLLYVYAPIQYCLLLEYAKAIGKSTKYARIRYDIIETIAIHSDNEFFKTARFRRALIAYRRFGYRPKKKVHWSLRDAIHYAKYSYFVHEMMKGVLQQ